MFLVQSLCYPAFFETPLINDNNEGLLAHEEENQGNDAENYDDDGEADKDSGSSEGWREDGVEIIQTSATDLISILTEIQKSV